MNIRSTIARWIEPRASLENPATSLTNPAAWLVNWAGGLPSKSGINVSEETATRLTAVYGCVRVLSGLIGMLPVNLYERVGKSGREIALGHPLQRLLHVAPNEEQTPFFYHQTIQSHALLWGNGYSAIQRGTMRRPEALLPLLPGNTRVTRRVGQLMYHTLVDGGEIEINPADVVHIPGLGFDGLAGRSPIGIAREAFALGMAAEDFGANFFGRGGQVSGVLEHPSRLGDTAARHIRESWESMHGGIDNSLKVAILEEGMKYQRVGIPPEDAQFLETRKFQVVEVCRMFGVPPHLIGDLERATFSNIEQQDLDLVRHTLMPWIVRYEQEYNRKLLRGTEQGQFFFKFNVDALMRGDSAARSAFYREMFGIGALSQNEIRSKEDMNPIDDGDKYFVPMNMSALGEEPEETPPEEAPFEESPEDNERIIRAHLPVFLQAANAVFKRERDGLYRCGKLMDADDDGALPALKNLYDTLPAYVAKYFEAPVRSLVSCITEVDDETISDHVYSIGIRYAAQSRKNIFALNADSMSIRATVKDWAGSKAERMAEDELARAIQITKVSA